MLRKIASISAVILMSLNTSLAGVHENQEKFQNWINSAKKIKFDESKTVPIYLEFGEEHTIMLETFVNSMEEYLSTIGDVRFEQLRTYDDHIGIRHIRYRQFINDIEVAYSNLVIHLENGFVKSFNGNYVNGNFKNAQRISESEALSKALDAVNADSYMWEMDDQNFDGLPEGDLVFLAKQMVSEESSLKLTYRFDVYASEPLSRQLIFVNAENGQIEFIESQLHYGGTSKGTAVTGYSDTQMIFTDSLSGYFVLVDSTRGNGIETYDNKRTRNFSGASLFQDADNFWNNFNANLDEYGTDAHWATAGMYDYMDKEFGRNSIDDSGFTLKSYVHYDVDLFNAFWDGQRMIYGDGDATSSPLTTIDIVGHEVAHGLTNFTSDLIYAFESGAINESFSDIFGTTLEFYLRPNKANWEVGEDAMRAIRSLANPKKFGDPDTYKGLNWFDLNCIPASNNDRCGVHTNSGVQNYWFYLISQGGTGVNDLSDTFNVAAIGISKAEQIAYRMQAAYLIPSSDFQEARFYGIQSAIDLYGSCSPEVESVTNAWYAVGIGDAYIDGVAADFITDIDTTFCYFPVDVNFLSKSSNVRTFKWNFGNGDSSSSRLPTTTFSSPGVYDIALIVDGDSCGSDTISKASYIKIDTNASCAYFLGDSVQTVSDVCEGRIYDSGGFGNDYGTDENGILHLEISSADFIELEFLMNEIEAGIGFSCNSDYIEIYDGSSTEDKSLGRYCKNFPPAGNKIRSTSNVMTLRFNSDRSVPTNGFLLAWKCMLADSSAKADFSVDKDTSCTGRIQFTNLSSAPVSGIQWEFGDGTISTRLNPSHIYELNGDYDVRMVVENSKGKNAITKFGVVHINRPDLPNNAPDTFCFGQDGGIRINSNDLIHWYRDTNDLPFFNGDSLTMVNIRKDTSFFIRAIDDNKTSNLGPLNSIGPGNYSTSNEYIEFDVEKPLRIESIVFFSERPGTRTLDLRNKDGEIIQSRQLYIPNGGIQVTLNIALLPDSNYRLSISDRDNGLFKNTSGAKFPYSVNGLVTLKRSSMPNNGYPYFYRWKVSELSCESVYERIVVRVDSSNANFTDTIVCDQMVWNGDILNSSGRYRFNEIDTNGCDRVEIIDLEILNSTLSTVRDTACDYYTWAENGQTYFASGLYTTKLQNALGCDSTVRLRLHIDSSTSISTKDTSCFEYTWSQTGQTIKESGLYYDTLNNSIGCDSIIILDLLIRDIDLSITKRGFDLTSNQTGANYKWLDCNDENKVLIDGDQKTFRAPKNGLYAVEIKLNGCIDTSICVPITGVGIGENTAYEELKIMPNPVSGILFIDFTKSGNRINQLRVMSSIGELIFSRNISNQERSARRIEIDLKNFANGVYYLTIRGELGQRTERIIKVD